MKSRLPATPLDALSISGALKAIVKTVHTCADIFGFWKYPLKGTAGNSEEMSLKDKIYWGYKSKNPTLYPEKGIQRDSLFKNNEPPSLPAGFKTTHSVSFSALGDLIKVDGLENSRDILYESVADLVFDKDISSANLESQLTGQDIGAYTFSAKETPALCCTEEQYDTLKSHKGKKLTVMNTCCNHTFDMGLEGLETTLAQLEKDEIIDLGTNRKPEEQQQGRIIKKNGIKMGFVSATFGLNGKDVPEGKNYMVNVVDFHTRESLAGGVDLSLLKAQVNFCKEQGCDIIIASLHWGYEYEFFPRQQQIEVAHLIVEEGVDVIVSHHAHVIQPVEYYRPERDPGRTAVITYSLGNLTSSFSAAHIVLNCILNLSIVKGKINGEEKTIVETAEIIPVVQRELMKDNLPIIKVEKLETLLAGNYEKEEQQYFAEIKKYADMILG
ncbi:MAG: CapA family protein [bacterium]|nr:CapA family protein [bacterium]